MKFVILLAILFFGCIEKPMEPNNTVSVVHDTLYTPTKNVLGRWSFLTKSVLLNYVLELVINSDNTYNMYVRDSTDRKMQFNYGNWSIKEDSMCLEKLTCYEDVTIDTIYDMREYSCNEDFVTFPIKFYSSLCELESAYWCISGERVSVLFDIDILETSKVSEFYFEYSN